MKIELARKHFGARNSSETWLGVNLKWILNFNVFTRLYSWAHNYRLISAIHLYHIFIGDSEPARFRVLSLRFFAGLRSSLVVCVMKPSILLLIHKISESHRSVSHHIISCHIWRITQKKKKLTNHKKGAKWNRLKKFVVNYGAERSIWSRHQINASHRRNLFRDESRVKGHVINLV